MPPEAGIGLLFLSNKIPCCLSQALSRHYKRDTLREGESVLFIGTQFSILYTSMYSPAGAAFTSRDYERGTLGVSDLTRYST